MEPTGEWTTDGGDLIFEFHYVSEDDEAFAFFGEFLEYEVHEGEWDY